jgi:hypothetical protein
LRRVDGKTLTHLPSPAVGGGNQAAGTGRAIIIAMIAGNGEAVRWQMPVMASSLPGSTR